MKDVWGKKDWGNATEDAAKLRGLAMESEVSRLRELVAAKDALLESWKGEVRNLVHDRPRALGERSGEIIDALVAERAAADERKRA